MNATALLFLILLAATGAATAATPASASAAADSAPASDTPATTARGHAFVVPAGWSLRRDGAVAEMTVPEGGSRIALVDLDTPGLDADAAVAAAWAAYAPASKWPLKRAGDRPVGNGWDQARAYQYASGDGAQRTVSARAMRRGGQWLVALFDMDDEIAATRDAQIEMLYGHLRPRGYRAEVFAGRPAHRLDAGRLAALRQFVESARVQFDVPGVALGLIQDGEVVVAEGFGVRETGKPEPVDADTLFLVASTTKAWTTLMLAKQVEAGRFGWDTPVTEVLPTFRLGDAATTEKVQIKHLVCACTGMPRQDMEWIFDGERMSPATVMDTLATMRPTSAFGELYQYSNSMAAAAGYVGAHALHPERELGAAYDAAMQALVFDPLAMRATTFDFARAVAGNHATPHSQDFAGRIVPAGLDASAVSIPMRPDGGAWSNVHDVLRYLRMELADGRLPDGGRYIAEAPLLARRAQQVARGADQGYGMGMKVDRVGGAPLMIAGGIMPGFVSEALWLPEHGVGAVLLTNADTGGIYLRSLFRRRLLEVLFDGHPEAVVNAGVQAQRMREQLAAEREGLTVPADAARVGQLATRYRSDALGEIAVQRKGAATWFDFGGWASEVAARGNDDGTVSFVTVSPGVTGYEFVLGGKAAGADARSMLRLRDAQREYEFTAVE